MMNCLFLFFAVVLIGLAVSAKKPAVKFRGPTLDLDKVVKALKFNKLHAAFCDSICDTLEKVVCFDQIEITNFMDPLEWTVVTDQCHENDISVIKVGGYREAVRNMLILSQKRASDSAVEEIVADNIGVISIKTVSGTVGGGKLTKESIQTALITSEGVEKDQVGDIHIISKEEAQIVVASSIIPILCAQLRSVDTSGAVDVRAIPLQELQPVVLPEKEITIVEASRRLDAVASGGLGLSRSRVVKWIDKGEVRVNWKEATSASLIVRTGDMITLKNGAKLVVGVITSTSKGKYRIQLRRSGHDQRSSSN